MEIISTVGIMFFKDKKLLINKPRLRPTYQIVGGHIEKGESPIQAIIRECKEELGDKAIFDVDKIKYVMDFVEVNTAFPNKQIHMHLFIYKGKHTSLAKGYIEDEKQIISIIAKYCKIIYD